MTDVVAEHKQGAPRQVSFAVLTLSSSRGPTEDRSGDLICQLLEKAGHRTVARQLLRDEPAALRQAIARLLDDNQVAAIVTTGGTGLAGSDITVETLQPLFEKELSGFQSLFAQLSYQQVEAAAMLSRATAGVVRGKIIFCLPGSPAACSLAVEKLILPEIGHILNVLRGPKAG